MGNKTGMRVADVLNQLGGTMPPESPVVIVLEDDFSGGLLGVQDAFFDGRIIRIIPEDFDLVEFAKAYLRSEGFHIV